ncbi:MAG TPA: ATPase domain-containing protein, partial [Thermodesulfobacteriota bacterium]|nr:ATPase domain-containing protein [Thermodesulfobacteriota bacterium]
DSFTALPFSAYAVSFLSDDLIRLRFVSIRSQLRKVLMIIKMRGGAHSKDIREYEITSAGVKIGECLEDYQGLITGIPRLQDPGERKELTRNRAVKKRK